MANPLGTVYNPLSIHQALEYVVHNELPLPSLYVESQGTWRNYAFHSSLSAPARDAAEKLISNSIGIVHHFVKDAAFLIITYGTAKAYHLEATGEVVANCHKMPGSIFSIEMLSPEKMEESFDLLYSTLKAVRPELKIILTVSPVRHVRDTLETNSASKASLRWACHCIVKKYTDTDYFPGYEIMIDDLRDYRFYEADMIHPSPVAIEYIWEKFADQYFGAGTRQLVAQWRQVSAALAHRPFHRGTSAHQKFLLDTLAQLEELKSLLPVDIEMEHLKSQLSDYHG